MLLFSCVNRHEILELKANKLCGKIPYFHRQCKSLHFLQIILGEKITTGTPLVICKNQVESKALIHKEQELYILKYYANY